MRVAHGRRGRVFHFLVLCAVMTATLAGCGQVGVSTGQALTTQAQGSGSVSVGSPQAPTVSGTPAAQAMVGTVYTFQPSAAGASGKGLTFSITNKPSWATFNANTGQLCGTPSAANMQVYSTPMTPPPTTISDLGRLGSSRI